MRARRPRPMQSYAPSSYRVRLWRLFALILLALAVVLGRLAWLQILSPDSALPEQSQRRQFYSSTIEPFRGDIVASGGEILATDALTFDVKVHYRRLAVAPPRWLSAGAAGAEHLGVQAGVAGTFRDERVPLWAARLARTAGRDVGEIMERRRRILRRVERIRTDVLNRNPGLQRIRGFRVAEETVPHVILENVPFDVAARIEARPAWFGDVLVEMKRRRVYPMGRVACHVVGGLRQVERGQEPDPPEGAEVAPDKAYRPGDEYGIQGIERVFDWQLRGTRGERWFQRRPRPAPDRLVRARPAQPGHTVELGLHLPAQIAAEQALEGEAGAAFVMDVRTGEVLVCASAPGYDLNLTGSERAALFGHSPGPFLNRAIQDPVPGGSVIKIATAVAGLQTGAFGPEESMSCSGVYSIGRWDFTCPAPHGQVDLPRSVEVSCNVFYFAHARDIGIEALAEWAQRLGLGRRTGIDLPFEAAGRFPGREWMREHRGRPWYPGDTLNMSIGQGEMQVTPAQVAVMMAAVANGGRLVRPRLVRSVRDREGGEIRMSETEPVLSPPLALDEKGLRVIGEGMRDVARTGTARRATGLADMNVAGKTGTAQTGRRGANHAWFAGYLPFDRPRYAFAVAVFNVPGGGGEVAAPIARDILQALVAEESE